MDNKNAKQIHFIVGIGRSGTTILTKLLNAYKEIHCVPEANFLLFFLYKFRHKTLFYKEDISLLLNQIELYSYSNPWIGYDFNYESIKQDLEKKIVKNNPITYQDLCMMIYNNFELQGINKTNAKLIIDKNPSYSLFIDQIHSAFNESKIIWIVRDYRANVLSWLQNPYLKSSNVAINAIRWKLYNKEVFRFYKKNKEKTLLIKYEDLIDNENNELQKIINFLGIPSQLENNYSESTKIDISNFSGSTNHKHIFIKKYGDLNKPLNAKRINAWKEELTPSQIKTCDVLCGSFSRETGYHPVNRISLKDYIITYISCLIPIINGYIDIYKDKLIYYVPIELKLKKLKSRYIKLGLINEKL